MYFNVVTVKERSLAGHISPCMLRNRPDDGQKDRNM